MSIHRMSIRRCAVATVVMMAAFLGGIAVAPSASARWVIHNGADITDAVPPPGGTDTQTCADRVRVRVGRSDSITPPTTPETYEVPNPAFFDPALYEVYADTENRGLNTAQSVFDDDGNFLGYEFSDGTPVPRLLSFTTPALTELEPPEPIIEFEELYAVVSTLVDRALPAGAVAPGDAIGVLPAGGEATWLILDVIACPPGAPTIQTASPGNGRATVRWSAPASNGGSPITGYTVTPYIGYYPLTPRVFSSTATTQVVTGLTNGIKYRFKVAAINAAGTGPQSTASNAVTPRTVPGAPTIQTASPGDGRATVRWSAPASNGGSPITGYTVTPYIGYYALTPRVFSSTATTQVVTGLTNGTTYRFKVAAINAAGTGPQSTASNAVTPCA